MVIPSGATHVGPKTGNYFKLVSLTPFKVMRWAGIKCIPSVYSELGHSEFVRRVKKLKSAFRGNV